MRIFAGVCALALLASCSSGQTLDVNEGLSEEELLAKTEHALGARIKERFGDNARLAAAVAQGPLTVLHVANAPSPAESDALLPVAIAIHDTKTNTLSVPAESFEYRDARVLGARTALVKTSGELEVIEADGQKRVVAERIKGDLAPAGASILAAQLPSEDEHAETKVVLISGSQVKELVEGDRASLSPDGETVLFVSAQSGVASFYVTNLEGVEPRQVTNSNLALSDDESEPVGFVPVPVNAARLSWLDKETVRFDAGGSELWTLNVRTGEATKVGGAP